MDTLTDTTDRRCANSKCGRSFEGRSDKAYCSDQCRNAAGREKKRVVKWQEPKCISEVDRILKRNYGILMALEKDIITTVPKWELLDRGFNFKFMTSILDSKGGIKLYCIYDRGWTDIQDDYVGLVKLPTVYNLDHYELPDFLKR